MWGTNGTRYYKEEELEIRIYCKIQLKIVDWLFLPSSHVSKIGDHVFIIKLQKNRFHVKCTRFRTHMVDLLYNHTKEDQNKPIVC